MKEIIIREKRHRLPVEMYMGTKAIAFTICIKERQELFISKKIFKIFENELLTSLNLNNCSAYIYLFMPDHLHMILKGEMKNSNIKKSIEIFKQKTGYWLSKNVSKFKWQKDYYDHIIRNDEDIQNQIRYILNNPVRTKIVPNWKEYPFKGSTIFNFSE